LATGVSAGLKPGEERKFGLLVGGTFVLLGLLLWRRGHPAGAAVSAAVGVALVLGGLAAPSRLGPVYRAWMTMAAAISKVTTPIVMSIIYFLVLTPSGFLVRLFGHRPLTHPREAATYWQERPVGSTRGDITHQF
jgi:hypothetical protein